jgi:hypothetical protein
MKLMPKPKNLSWEVDYIETWYQKTIDKKTSISTYFAKTYSEIKD